MKRLVLAALLSASLTGCLARRPPPPAPAVRDVHPADALRGFERIPEDATMLMVARTPLSLANALGRAPIMAREARRVEQMVFGLVRDLGDSPLHPEGLRALGVAPNGRAGFARLAGRGGAHVVFVTIADRDRLKRAAYKAAASSKALARLRVMEDGILLNLGRDRALLIGERHAFLFSARGRGAARRLAGRAARLEPGRSLRHAPRVRRAMAGVDPMADAAGYVDLRALAYEDARMNPRWHGATLEAARQSVERARQAALAKARAKGAGAAAILRIDGAHRRFERRLARSLRAKRLRAWLGDVDGLGLSMWLQPSGVRVRGSVALPDDSLWARLVDARPSGTAALLMAPASPPSVVLRGALDPETLADVAVASLAGRADPLERRSGVDLRTLAGELTGAFALTVNVDEVSEAPGLTTEDLAISLEFELARPRDARELVGKICNASAMRGLFVPDGEHFVAKAPGIRPVKVGVVDSKLVISSDPDRFDPAKRARVRGVSWKGHPFGGTRRGGGALEVGVELGLLPRLLASADRPQVEVLEEAGAFHDVAVPRSKRYLAKQAALKALDARITERRKTRETRRQKRVGALADRLGPATLRVMRGEGAIELQLDVRTSGEPLDDVVAAMVHRWLAPSPADDPEERKLLRRRERLADDLDTIFDADREAHESKPVPAPEPKPAPPPKPAPAPAPKKGPTPKKAPAPKKAPGSKKKP